MEAWFPISFVFVCDDCSGTLVEAKSEPLQFLLHRVTVVIWIEKLAKAGMRGESDGGSNRSRFCCQVQSGSAADAKVEGMKDKTYETDNDKCAGEQSAG